MLPPLPRCSGWGYVSLMLPSRISLPRKGCRVGPHIVLFEVCSAFTHVAACPLALSPIRDTLIEGFSHFVTSMTAPIASGGSEFGAALSRRTPSTDIAGGLVAGRGWVGAGAGAATGMVTGLRRPRLGAIRYGFFAGSDTAPP